MYASRVSSKDQVLYRMPNTEIKYYKITLDVSWYQKLHKITSKISEAVRKKKKREITDATQNTKD